MVLALSIGAVGLLLAGVVFVAGVAYGVASEERANRARAYRLHVQAGRRRV